MKQLIKLSINTLMMSFLVFPASTNYRLDEFTVGPGGSDNTASNKLIDILGFEYINNSFEKIGLNNTILNRKLMDFSLRQKGIENYISCSDLSLVLEKVYTLNNKMA